MKRHVAPGQAVPLHPEAAAFADHYGFVIDVLAACRATGKGRVERQVDIGREHVLSGRRFDSLAEMDAAFAAWVPIRHGQVHRTHGEIIGERAVTDRAALKPDLERAVNLVVGLPDPQDPALELRVALGYSRASAATASRAPHRRRGHRSHRSRPGAGQRSCATPTATSCERPVAAALASSGRITSIFRSPLANRTTGTPQAAASRRTSSRNRVPIFSRIAGDAIG